MDLQPRQILPVAFAGLLAASSFAAEGRKPTPAEESGALFKQGMAAKMKGDTTAALEAFTRAMELNSSIPGARLARGLTFLDAIMANARFELTTNAERDLEKAVEDAPRNPLALSALALVRAISSDRRGEMDVAKAAGLRDQLPAYGYAAIGRYRLEDKQWKDAVAAYKKAYDTSPADSPLREFIRRELIVARDRIRIRRDAVLLTAVEAKPPEPEFEPEPFIEQLGSADAKERVVAAKTLGRPGLETVVEDLAAMLKDPDLEVRATALQALGRIGAPRGVRPILPVLEEKSKYMRALAARALGDIGSERARKPLEELIKREKEPLVLADAKKAIKEIDNAAYSMKMDLELIMEELAGAK
ncbi:MAG: HEAT repeat-containing protein [Elusimicrobia bacterium]|nr:MAG: HEAT repeat-containing protein [Elusimicrobiota bacterium]